MPSFEPKQKLFLQDAAIARDRITREQMENINHLYTQWADEIGELAKQFQLSGDAAQARYYIELRNQLRDSSRAVSNAIYTGVRGAMYEVSDSVMRSSVDWLTSLGYSFEGVSAAMSNVPRDAVNNIITGQIYDTGWSLSARIWGNNEQTLEQLYRIVAGGIAENRSIYEISLQLQQYVNPNVQRAWNLKDRDGRWIYPRKIDYNAQRLARTLVQHSYQQSVVDASRRNPFVQLIRWDANGSRVCELCQDRDGNVYPIDELPLDHPNGMCNFEPVHDDYDEIANRIVDWIVSDEGDYPDFDDYARSFGFDYE